MQTGKLAQSVSLSGHHAGDVLEVIRRRAASRSRDDGNTLALVVEGGSMRGVYTAGSLLGLHAMGLWNLFDNVYGTSAGAVNAGHFLSGFGDSSADTYYRYLVDGRFLNPFRFWKIVDIDFFVDEVLARLRRLEIEPLMASKTPLWVSLMDYVTAKPLLLRAQAGTYPILRIMKAAVAIPVLYNKLIPLGDFRCFDAGFYNPFPLDAALAHGNTHILVLLTKPQSFVSVQKTWFEKLLFHYRFAHGRRDLDQLFETSRFGCDRLRDWAHGRVAPPDPTTSIATVSPLRPEVTSRTQDPAILREQMISTARGTLELFDHSQGPLDEWVVTHQG